MLHPSPLKEISPQDLEQRGRGDTKDVTYASMQREKLWILRMKKFLGLAYSLLLGMTAPLNLEKLNCSTPRDSVLLI
jgi:hypothetical protein